MKTKFTFNSIKFLFSYYEIHAMNISMTESLKKIKEINFLSELEKHEIVSQNKISKKIFVSLGMVNALLKKAISKGFVKVKSAPYKRYIYYLTKRGFLEKSNLVREYLEDSLSFFKKAKLSYMEIFKKLKKKKIYIIGKGDLVDISRLAAMEVNVKLSGHFIFNANKELQLISGVYKKNDKNIVYVIVESSSPQEVYDGLKKIVSSKLIIHPNILHVSDFESK